MEDIHRKEKDEETVNANADTALQTEKEKKDQPPKKQTAQKQDKKGAKQPPKKKTFFGLVNWKWVVTAFLSSLVISIILSLLSAEVLNIVPIIAAVLILFAFVFLGIIFDIIGLAVATANEKPFNSMAAQRIKAGKTGLALIRKADQVSSFCNDVIGDICGVVSGSASATIAVQLLQNFEVSWPRIVNLLMSAFVAGLTVGGKAVGKTFAVNSSTSIVYFVGRVISWFHRIPDGFRKKK